MDWADNLAFACSQEWASNPEHPASLYLAERGVKEPSVGIGVGALGDCPPEFATWAARHGWMRSVVCPVRTWLGTVAGFVVRNVDDKVYLRYEVYDGQSTPAFWGAETAFEAIVRTQHIILAEGVFDALACRYAGGQNVVATLSANPSQGMLRWVKRLAKRVTVLYDMDDAGRKGARSVSRLEGLVVSAPTYGAHDPWDLWRTRPDALRALVQP